MIDTKDYPGIPGFNFDPDRDGWMKDGPQQSTEFYDETPIQLRTETVNIMELPKSAERQRAEEAAVALIDRVAKGVDVGEPAALYAYEAAVAAFGDALNALNGTEAEEKR